MKSQTLPTKRKPVTGFLRKLNAVTGSRKQRAATTANASDFEIEDSSSKISRALTIIVVIHVVAIGLIFVHQRFLDGNLPPTAKSSSTKSTPLASLSPAANRTDLPRFTANEKPYIVRQGDNYARIATTLNVDEKDLRLLNQHIDIVPGLLLKVPPQRIAPATTPVQQSTAVIAETALEPVEIPPAIPVSPSELVDVVPAEVVQPLRAKPVQASSIKPKTPAKPEAKPVSIPRSGNSYTVKKGDNPSSIARRYNISEKALMKANGITDPKKMKLGASLVIPK